MCKGNEKKSYRKINLNNCEVLKIFSWFLLICYIIQYYTEIKIRFPPSKFVYQFTIAKLHHNHEYIVDLMKKLVALH